MLLLYCPLLKSGGTKEAAACLYKCKVGTKAKCAEYSRNYEALKSYKPEQKCLDKYGAPTLTLPNSLRKKRKKRVEKVLEQSS